MGSVVLADDQVIDAPPSEVFGLFGRSRERGWLFGATCDEVRPGSVIRLLIPMGNRFGGEVLEGTGRIVAVEPNRRIVLNQETPWRGTLTCTIRPEGKAQSRVRVVAEVPEDALAWLLRRGGGDATDPGDPEAWPVGLLVSQSGPASVFAGASVELARLAIDEVNADGRVAGRYLRLEVGDDGTDPKRGAAELRRLVERCDCRVVITNVISSTFSAIARIAERAGVLLIYSPVNEGGPCGQGLFRFGERPLNQLRGSIPRLMRATGGRRWYLAGNNYCWPKTTNRSARRIIERSGGTVVGTRYEALGRRQFEPLLEDIAQSGAELIVSTFIGGDEVEFERQCYEYGLRDRCQTIALALDEATRDHVGDAAGAGLWSPFGYFEQLATSANRQFIERYRSRVGPCAPPVSSLSESVYEAVHLHALAARKAHSWEPDAVGRALEGGVFDGPRGRVAVRDPSMVDQGMFLARSVVGGLKVHDQIA
jgi:branched-chain amino acid transport system substrate-binding protein